MDWDKAITRYSPLLMRIVAALFALLASARLEGVGLSVPRHIWRSVLSILRPAESAVRRLIVIAARSLETPEIRVQFAFCEGESRPAGTPEAEANSKLSPNFPVTPAFRLFDPLKPVHGIFADEDNDAVNLAGDYPASEPDDFPDEPVNAMALHNRLRALRHALADLPKQAARLARFNARRDAFLKAGRPVRLTPIRPGLPPGWRERGRHEVDMVLKDCHLLVRHLEDTS